MMDPLLNTEDVDRDSIWAEDEYVKVDESQPVSKACLDFKVLWTYMGPAWLMSIAYIDPGNLEADLQAGAYAGYQLLWVLMWCTFIGFILQVMAARLGVATGKGLAELCREEYGTKTVRVLWIMTELAIIGSDVQEVIGGAIALRVLFNIALPYGTVIMAVSTFAILGLQRFGIRKVEIIFAGFILVMCVAFWWAMSIAKPDVPEILEGVFVPDISSYAITQAVGILGAVIMPHNIYLHSALVTSRRLNRADTPRVAESMKYNAIESSMSLFMSFLINLAVVATYATSYFQIDCASRGDGEYQACVPLQDLPSAFINPGECLNAACTSLSNYTQSCVPSAFHGDAPTRGFVCANIGLTNAGDALSNLFPNTHAAKYIWGVGLLAAGQASTVTGTYAGQFVMSGFLNIKIKAWQRMIFTRMVALGPAIAVAWVTQGYPNSADITSEWLNVLQSVQLPFALLPVLHLTSQRRYMGVFANKTWLKVVCWLLAVIVMFTNIFLVYTSLRDMDASALLIVVVCVAACFYFSLIFIIIRHDLKEFVGFVREMSGRVTARQEY